MHKHFWGAVVILLPIFIRFQEIVVIRHSQDGFFAFCTVMYVVLFGINSKGLRRNYPVILSLMFLGFLAWANQYDYLSARVNLQLNYFFIGLICFTSILSNLGEEDYEVLLNYIAVSCLVQSIWAVAGVLGLDVHEFILSLTHEKLQTHGRGWMSKELHPPPGSLGQPTVSAVLISISSFSLCRKKWILGLPLAVASLIYLGSASAVIAFCFCSMIYIAIDKYGLPRWTAALSIPALLGIGAYGIFFPGGFLSHNGRFPVWADAISMAGFTFHGKGLGYFADHFNKQFKHYWSFHHAHNELIDAYVAFGLIGLVIIGFVLVKYFKSVKDNLWFVMGIALLINSLTLHTFHISPIGLVGIIILCQGLNKSRRGYNGIY